VYLNIFFKYHFYAGVQTTVVFGNNRSL